MARSGLLHVRFMDDILVLAPTRWKLRRAVNAVNCQRRSKMGPRRRHEKGPLGGCELVHGAHGRAPRAARAAASMGDYCAAVLRIRLPRPPRHARMVCCWMAEISCLGGEMAKVVCVLYDDPIEGYPESYARDEIPKLEQYPDGQTMPTPSSIDFTPGHLLGSVTGELGLRTFLEERGHTLVVTADKDGPDSVLERELPDANVIISQPFWPAYLTADRMARAPNLKLAITAGIGSDHVDLQAAIDHGITVAEVTYCNSISVSEHVVMMILALVRNYIPSYGWVVKGGWNIADAVSRSYDLEGMVVGTVGAGRIGIAVLRRLKPFDVDLHYADRHRLDPSVEQELGLTYHEDVESLVGVCDVITINCPLHPETEHMFDDALISKAKRGAYIVNTARGKICDKDAVSVNGGAKLVHQGGVKLVHLM